MNELLITIAIPTYNNEKTIQKAITSCLNQDSDELYEILIVNNASNDNTSSLIQQYEAIDKVKIVTNLQTVSLFENHNVCLKNASGKYVVFCHSDDILEKHAIKTLSEKIKERNYPDKYILWGHSMFRDFSICIEQTNFSINELIVGQYAPLLFMYAGLTPSGTCYSKNSFLELNGFLKVTHRLAPSDMTTMLFLALNGFRFEMIDEMIFIRTDASTAIHNTKIEDTLQSFDDAFITFLQNTDKKAIEQLLNISARVNLIPFSFYYALAQDLKYKFLIIRRLVKQLLKHPLQMRNKTFPRLIKRLLFK